MDADRRRRRPERLLAILLVLAGCSTGGPGKRPATDAAAAREKDGREEAGTPAIGLDEARARAEREPREPYWSLRIGEIYAELDSLPQAEGAFHAALARDPAYAPALSRLSRLYYVQGRHEEGIELLRTALAQWAAPEGRPHSELLVDLALHLEAQGEMEEAEELLSLSGRDDAGSPAIGAADDPLALRGDRPGVAGLRRACAADSARAANLNHYGMALLREGSPDQARKVFLRALEIVPDLPGPMYNLAILERFYALDDEAGRRWFERYRTVARDDPEGLEEIFAGEPPQDPSAPEEEP